MPKAIVLVSGGLDSCVSATWAAKQFGPSNCIPISFAYGQRHARELVASERISEELFGVTPRTVNLTQAFSIIGGSSLTSGIRDGNPSTEAVERTPSDLPPTFVPGRNILMVSIAASLGYVEKARFIVGGWNILDYSGYPDCRIEFFTALASALSQGLGMDERGGVVISNDAMQYANPDGVIICAPIIHSTKAEIIRLGNNLDAPLQLTWSCYAGGSSPCGECDSCKIRAEGFAKVGIEDPAVAFYGFGV